jgi:outer membrane protein OmpA-like peptidoglycan-associated protein
MNCQDVFKIFHFTGGEKIMRKKLVIGFLIVSFVLATLGCADWSRTQKGAVIGAGTAGAIGGLVAKNTVAGILIGAAIGGAAGGFIGNYMDKQAAEIERDIEGAKVERVGEGVKITFDSGLLFDIDKAALKPQTRSELNELTGILNKYPDTHILLAGHTDSTGREDYNMQLSRSRAQSVADYLVSRGVDSGRFTVEGFGPSEPVASNDTPAGRAQNRRVEVAIWANEKLKKVAREKSG